MDILPETDAHDEVPQKLGLCRYEHQPDDSLLPISMDKLTWTP